jgi:hypothetical protein
MTEKNFTDLSADINRRTPLHFEQHYSAERCGHNSSETKIFTRDQSIGVQPQF